ncbi:MAG TPA: calcium-translocating P-type ATPase, PMCA-type [Bacillota bacterium]|nr:calcium-translocating P-type ATPase, PMCA-type [Bacillota bacterium]HPF41980.1 calcium-translocating P-type ATPase, PMCA-type [Bacillota bacterium]HPJ85946.1 calcium-translocating P-type ATPase, PMCA-type [Bacillota bacterium]HPQ61840.1 calcium-translocating P-type ATPase, PMCA-type [Bacillota bacterium]HRX91183.1 calcium-translocating P-type ATPase, PMCA-type [Candidatus Izemoplasmatales bacterium]
MDAYQKNTEELLKEQNVRLKEGLSSEEANARIERFGRNELKEKKKTTLFQMFLEQFKDFLVIILLGAAVVSIITAIFSGEGLVDGIAILAIVIINAILGVSQEQKANNALAALKKMSSPHAKVLRDGIVREISSVDLVPGDIVYLETGDYVAADVRLLESTNLQINESSLTGESQPVEKDARVVYHDDTVLAERHNVAYMSTLVTYGKAIGIVTGTGMETEIGKIATMLEAVEEGKTPLQKTIDVFAKMLGFICIGVSVVVFVLGLLEGQKVLYILLTAIALAVAAIPEGLTAVITVVLALGMQRMVKRHAIIKNLSTVETLGQATVICSDKTGTLTQNEMTVRKVYDLEKEYDVTGTGYELSGDIIHKDKKAEVTGNLDTIMKISLLCNDAIMEEKKVLGDPTEGALLVLAVKGGYTIAGKEDKYPQINEYSFDSERKMMSSINKINGEYYVLTKGACDQLIKKCDRVEINGEIRPITKKDVEKVLAKNQEFSEQAYRVLGYAYQKTDTPEANDLEQNLIFVGLTAMIDPPRPEAKTAIEECHHAGIRVMMITGDHLATAKAIASELGILKPGHLALSGEDTAKMTDEEFEEAILKCDVFARSTPQDKIRIVEILQKHGETVAMTGDGVNDSPALKQADIGVAMGITGTEVSKEASNMILTDDNFASIVNAVEEGRIIYANIRKFTIYLISCNIGEILVILLAMVFSFLFKAIDPETGALVSVLPLSAIHLLWINLMTDSFPAFALGMEKGEKGIMDEKPRSSKEKLLNKETLIKVFVQGFGLSVAALLSFWLGLNAFPGADLFQARTMIFVTVVFGELFRAYSARSETKFICQSNPFANKYVNYSVFVSVGLLLLLVYIKPFAEVFGIEALSGMELFVALSLGFIPMLSGEVTKFFHGKKNDNS